MASNIHQISGLRSVSARPLTFGALRPSQKALLSAWQSKALPPSAQHFMDLVRAGTQRTGRAKDYDKVAVSQIPERLAGQLAALTRPEGVQRFAAQLLYDAPEAGKVNLAALSQRAVLPAVQAQALTRAIDVSRVQGAPTSLMAILVLLPYKIAQSILDERGAAIEAFLKSWTEDLALNAELDAKAAKVAAEKAAQAQQATRHASELSRTAIALNVKKQNLVQATRSLDAKSSAFAGQLLKQRKSVLTHTVALAMTSSGAVATGSLVERSLDGSDRAQELTTQLAPIFNVATLDALDTPEDDLGPRLGAKRGRQGISG